MNTVVDRSSKELLAQPNQAAHADEPVRSGALVPSVLASTALLSACLGGGGSGGEATAPQPISDITTLGNVEDFSFESATTDAEAARFLLQTQMSASEGEVTSVRTRGFARYLVERMDVPIAQTGFDWLDARGYGFSNVASPDNYYDQSYMGDDMAWQQLITAPDAVRKRASLALSEFFVVSLNGLDISWRSHFIAAYWDVLNTHAFGNFRNLLEAITLNPAMGLYLNTRGNQKANSSGRAPDENYAREVMQLFTIGLHDLNLDGTERLSGGRPIESYTSADVSNLARVFTGWDLDQRPGESTVVNGRTIPTTDYARRPMRFIQSRNSEIGATLFVGTPLSVTISPGTANSGTAALKVALDTLFNHPNVGPFFAKQMIQRLITSNPTPAYVARVASVFNNNGRGVRGDLKATFAAIWLDDEARSPAALTSNTYGKLREPMLRFVQWARTFGLASNNGRWRIGNLSDASSQLGQSPLRSPSVFNFFRPGYVPPATQIASNGQVAPEFQIVNETSVGGYLNYMYGVVRNGLFGGDMVPPYTAELALAASPVALIERLNLLMCAGQISQANRTLMVSALDSRNVTANSSAQARRDNVFAAILMVMACPEYIVQK